RNRNRNRNRKAGTRCCKNCCHNSNNERQLATPTAPYDPMYNAADWFEMFEEVARANNWTPQTQLDVIPIYLRTSGRVIKWFRQNRVHWEATSSGGVDVDDNSTCHTYNDGDDSEDFEDEDDWNRFETFKRLFLDEFGSPAAIRATNYKKAVVVGCGIFLILPLIILMMLDR
ncbi:hypothetical protein EC991_004120, partial [Linnemannia zychae]